MSFHKRNVVIAGIVASILTAGVAAGYTPDANAPRSSVPDIYKWDATPLFKNDGAFEAAMKDVGRRLTEIGRFKGKLASADGLAACLEEFFSIRQEMERVMLYSNLKNEQDTDDKAYEKMRQRALTLFKEFSLETSFVKQEILRMGDEDAKNILADGKIAPYKEYLKDIMRRKSHVLGEEAEGVLSLAGDNLWSELDLNEIPSDVELIFKAVTRDIQLPKIKDENGKEVQLTLSNYSMYRASKDRRVRSETVEAFFASLKKYNNIMAQTLGGEMKRDVFMAKARGYKRAIDAYFDRQNVDTAVVDNLIRTVNANVKTLHRYVSLRKKLLNLPDVRIYDLYTPIVPAVDAEVPYEEAMKDVTEALKPLGDDYIAALAGALRPGSGWIDIYPNKGKESGAFSSAIWGRHPYVKLNYANVLNSASTLAHELGHAIHSHLNMNAQGYPDFGYSTLLAEIASTFNETLFSDYLLNKYKNDNSMRLYLLGETVETIRTTIFRQALFAEFENKIHEAAEKGIPLTADLMNKTYIDLIGKYYGPGFTIGENDDVEWAYIPHFYWKFYVFSYATGLSSGIAMADMVRTEGEKARDRYIAMLKESYTVPALETLKRAGVDLTKPAAIEAAVRLMDRTMAEMEKIVIH